MPVVAVLRERLCVRVEQAAARGADSGIYVRASSSHRLHPHGLGIVRTLFERGDWVYSSQAYAQAAAAGVKRLRVQRTDGLLLWPRGWDELLRIAMEGPLCLS